MERHDMQVGDVVRFKAHSKKKTEQGDGGEIEDVSGIHEGRLFCVEHPHDYNGDPTRATVIDVRTGLRHGLVRAHLHLIHRHTYRCR